MCIGTTHKTFNEDNSSNSKKKQIGWCPDYVYYIQLDWDIITDYIFSTREEVNNFAMDKGVKHYSILEWDVHLTEYPYY